MSASLASSSNRNATLAKHAMTLQNWVDWSARMGQRLAADEALRTRYSLLLHEAIQKLESR